MKRVLLAIVLIVALASFGVAHTEGVQANSGVEITIPDAPDYFGEPVESGYLNVATDFAGNYEMFGPVGLDRVEHYRARMEELGYTVNDATMEEGVRMWLFSADGTPFLVLAFGNRQVVLCLRDGIVCHTEVMPTPAPTPVPTPVPTPAPTPVPTPAPALSPGASSIPWPTWEIEIPTWQPLPEPVLKNCMSCYGTGTCSFCNGSGIYRNYGSSTVCGACGGTGVCGVCGGTGKY